MRQKYTLHIFIFTPHTARWMAHVDGKIANRMMCGVAGYATKKKAWASQGIPSAEAEQGELLLDANLSDDVDGLVLRESDGHRPRRQRSHGGFIRVSLLEQGVPKIVVGFG